MPPTSSPADSAGQKARGALAGLLTAASLLILLGFLWPGSLGRVAHALLVCAAPVLLILLGQMTTRRRLLLAAMTSLWLLLSGSWVALIWLDGAGVRTLAGIPLVLWILILGLGLLPLALVSWASVATFGPRQAGLEATRPTAPVADRTESGDP